MKKKNIILIIILVIILLIGGMFFVARNDYDSPYLSLNGASHITIFEGEAYQDLGYKLYKDEKDNNTYQIDVVGNVDVNVVGNYTVKYQLKDKNSKVIYEIYRTINVIAHPISFLDLTLNGDEFICLLLEEEYKELGATATRGNININNEIQTIGVVDTSNVGTYNIEYVVNIDNKTKSVNRTVNVIEVKANIDSNNLKINLTINSDNYAYITLPDNTTSTLKTVSYSYNTIGDYKFIIYMKDGSKKEYVINIKTIDTTKPTGTCTATITNGTTNILINANDASGINRYVYNNQTYYTNNFTINKILSSANIRVYDNANNYQDIVCSIKRVFNNNMNNINLSNVLTSCNSDWSSYNNELDKLMKEYGYKTRDAVAAAALYLAEHDYKVAYSWGGKYLYKGLNPKWGCTVSVTKDVCTKSYGNMKCMLGLDCTGYTSWAFVQAGFDKSILRTHSQSTGNWGNFNAKSHRYSFLGNQDKVHLIKPGDIVHTEGHVGIVIGTSDTMLKVANMHEGIKISYINKSNGKSTNGDKSFDNFVLFDDFFKMYGA